MPPTRYDSVQITLHWLTAAFFIAAVVLIWIVGELPRGDLRTTLFFIHRSCGITVLGLAVIRLAWRLLRGAPPMPAELPEWQRIAAVATHWVLYALIFVMPVTGFISSAAGGHTVSFFFLFDLPQLPENKDFAKGAETVHVTLQWLIYAVVLLHTIAALRHHFVLRDNVLRRMLPASRV